jgi:hypothetical protein
MLEVKLEDQQNLSPKFFPVNFAFQAFLKVYTAIDHMDQYIL